MGRLPKFANSGKLLIIPASITSLKTDDCGSERVQEVQFEPNSKMKTLDLQQFRPFPSLKSLTIPATVEILGKGWLALIGNPVGLETLTFAPGSRLRILNEYAFCGCDFLKSIVIPASVVKMTGRSFEYSGIRTIEIAKGNTKFRKMGDYVVNTKGNCLVRYAGFDHEVTIGDEITKLDQGCFSGCDWISAIHFGSHSKIREIPPGAFELCRRLESLWVPASIESLGRLSFGQCSRLRTVSFAAGSKLMEIEAHAFYACYRLESISLPPSLATIGSHCFDCCFNLTSVIFAPKSVVSKLHQYTFQGCFALKSLTLPASLTRIAEKCFLDCDSLVTVSFASPSRIRDLLDLPPYCGPTDIPDSVENLVLSGGTDGRSGWLLNFGLQSRLRRITIMAHCFLSTEPHSPTYESSARFERDEWNKDPEHPPLLYYGETEDKAPSTLIARGFLRFATRTVKQWRAEKEFEVFRRKVIVVHSDSEEEDEEEDEEDESSD
jgi:hypothetical protein